MGTKTSEKSEVGSWTLEVRENKLFELPKGTASRGSHGENRAKRDKTGTKTQNASRTLAFEKQVLLWGDSLDPYESHESRLQEKLLRLSGKLVKSFFV
ncbi:MAG: hypothetical protein WBD87_16250 [Candidatus Acidiferrales bacterium]